MDVPDLNLVLILMVESLSNRPYRREEGTAVFDSYIHLVEKCT